MAKLWGAGGGKGGKGGMRGVYRGGMSTIIHMVPSSFMFFAANEAARAHLPTGGLLEGQEKLRFFIAGGIAGVVEWTR